MAHQSLYRKWRPRDFDEVVDQHLVVQTLVNSLKGGRWSHAYLFAGPRGTGKTSVARILARALNCEEGPTPHPCNRCESCLSILEGSALDVMEIDAASNRGIDDIRELREKVSTSPARSRMKVYIVDEVHMLTTEAFNALLKMLEEPPSHAIFVLATTEPHKVPATIASRCQRFDFQRVPSTLLAEHLQRVSREEGLELDPAAALLISRAAHGSVRDALVTLEQVSSFIEGKVTAEAAGDFLGLIGEGYLDRLCELLASGDGSGLLLLVAELERQGKDLLQFAREALERLRRIFIIQNTDAGPEFLDLSREEYESLRRHADALHSRQTPGYLRILQETAEEMRQSNNPRTVLEMGLIRLVRPEMEMSVEALALRLERLEEKLEELLLERQGLAPSRYAPAPVPPSPAGAGMPASPLSPGKSKIPPAQSSSGQEKPDGEAGKDESAETDLPSAAIGGEPPETRRPAEATPAAAGTPAALDISAVKRGWSRLKERVKERSLPVSMSLSYGYPAAVKGGVVFLRFHPDARLSFEKVAEEPVRAMIEQCLREVFHADLKLKPYLETGRGAASPPRGAEEPGGGRAKPSPQADIGAPPREVRAGREKQRSERADEHEAAAAAPGPGGDGSSGGETPGASPPPESKGESKKGGPSPRQRKPQGGREGREGMERHLVRLVTDVFDGAEVVEEIQLPPPEGERLHE